MMVSAALLGFLACARVPNVAPEVLPSQPVTIPLEGVFNHDLLDGSLAPLLRLATRAPLAADVPLDIDPDRQPDALLLKSSLSPEAPAEARVPIGRSARTAYLVTACQGPLEVRDVVADGEIVFDDGRTQPLKWLAGEQAWPAWAAATGRHAEVLPLGTNPSGHLVGASLLTVDVAYPDTPIREVVLRSRSGALAFALLAVTVSDGPPVTPQGGASRGATLDGYPFEVRRLPGPALPAITQRVLARDGHLVLEDGTRWRGVGINLVGAGALPPVGEEEAWAERIANLGFNLARLHHLDAEGAGLMSPRRGKLRDDGMPEPTFLAEGRDRLDRFTAALARRGVRLVLEGWTLRGFRAGEGVTAPEGVPLGNKSAAFYLPDWEASRQDHFRGLWGRVNPYTGRRYADDPAVAWVELANEDSLLVQWAGGNLDKLPGAHRDALDRRWSAWLRAKYGTDARLAAAWSGRMRSGLQPGESLELDSVAREPSARNRTELWPHARAVDLVTFLGELERGHHARMAAFVRDELGFTAPRVCNTSFGVPLAEAAVEACEIVDLHLYWDPPPEQTVFTDRSILAAPMQNRFLEKLAWCQEGRPCTVSELDHTFPARHGQEAPLVWATIAARQDWDALAWFAWSHAAMREGAAPEGSHDLQGRANVLAQLPAVRAIFGQAALPPAPAAFTRWWSAPALLRDLAEPPALWLDPQADPVGVLGRRLRTSFVAVPPSAGPRGLEPQPPVGWDVDGARLTVSTPRVEATVGVGLGGTARVMADTRTFAAVSFVSLGSGALGQGPALFTVVGRAEREGTLWGEGPSLRAWGRGPVRLERLTGSVTFAWPRRPVVTLLDGDAAPAGRVSVIRSGRGRWRVALDDLRSPWLRVE